MIAELKRVVSGEIDRLMIFMPPGYAKTLYASILTPAFFFAQADNLNVIGTSYASTRAEEISGKAQTYIRRNSKTLGYGLLTESVDRWTTTNGGTYLAAGVGGGITGFRSNLTVIDDPFKGALEAESETTRDRVWNWYLAEVYTRKKALTKNRIVLIMTRWHEDDLAGRLLAAQEDGGDQWTVLKLPALCDSPDDALGREIGEPLWPENEDREALEKLRKTVGPYVWGALYQQDPKPRGAAYFSLDDLLVPAGTGVVDAYGAPVMEPVPMPEKCDAVLGIVDTAIKSGQQHNSTAVSWYSYNRLLQVAPVNILDWDIVQIEGASQMTWLESLFVHGEGLARQCGARRGFAGIFIEDKATGTVLIQQAKNKRLPVYAIDSKLTAMGKEERAIAASPYVTRGDIKITKFAYEKTKVHKGRSANHLVSQVLGFRLGSKETDGLDLFDTFCYGVAITRGAGGGDGKGI